MKSSLFALLLRFGGTSQLLCPSLDNLERTETGERAHVQTCNRTMHTSREIEHKQKIFLLLACTGSRNGATIVTPQVRVSVRPN